MANTMEERATKLKELSDLKSEIQETERLLREGRLDKLPPHLQSLKDKYLLETGVYNMSHPFPPKDTLENAQNCINFLSALLAGKIANIGEKN